MFLVYSSPDGNFWKLHLATTLKHSDKFHALQNIPATLEQEARLNGLQ